MRKGLLAGSAAVAAALVVVPSAIASNATIIGTDTITVTASANEVNRIVVTYDAGADTYTVADSAANITASGLCVAIDSHSVSCPGSGITRIDVDVGRANDSAELDRLTIPTAVEGRLDGDSGNDILLGANGPGDIRGASGRDLIDGRNGADDLHGGSGTDTLVYPPERSTALFVTVGAGNNNDGNELDQTGARRDTVHGDIEVVFGAAGPDFLVGDRSAETLVGGPGNDLFFGMRGSDTLVGGDGDDLLFGMRGNDNLLGLLGNDLLSGGAGDDTARGSFGSDRVLGGPDNDRLVGGADNDFVRGKKGHDVMKGNTGIDAINAKDGMRDVKINCGPGPKSQEWAKRDKRRDPRPRSC
jgi:Ca2+-binding RTX toxin-like protein